MKIMKTKLFDNAVNELEKKKKEIQKALDRTVADCKQRGPAQVTKAVTAVYGIKAKDVTEAGKGAKRNSKTVGTIQIQGYSVDNLQLVYSGRLLTPVHFSMTPKSRPDSGKKYKVKAGIFKGSKKMLGTGVFLAPSGAAGTAHIPFKRVGAKRLPIKAIRTLSIPQMITNEIVAQDIKKKMEDLLQTRLKHNLERVEKK